MDKIINFDEELEESETESSELSYLENNEDQTKQLTMSKTKISKMRMI